jgi:hypothetical protein
MSLVVSLDRFQQACAVCDSTVSDVAESTRWNAVQASANAINRIRGELTEDDRKFLSISRMTLRQRLEARKRAVSIAAYCAATADSTDAYAVDGVDDDVFGL